MATHAQPIHNFRKLRDGSLFVDEFLAIELAKFLPVEGHAVIGSQNAFSHRSLQNAEYILRDWY